MDKLLEYKRSWIQHVNRMPRNRLPRVMKSYSPTGRRNQGRPLTRFLDTWDRNGSTSGPTAWQTCDNEDDDDDYENQGGLHRRMMLYAWWEVECIYNMVRKPKKKMRHETFRCTWEDNIKVDLIEMIWEYVEYIYIYIYIYTGSTKKIYTHFNERKLHVV